MKRGLVIGKFMPLHKGHVALIHFAAQHCDELIVSMSYKESDPIPGPLRFEWIREEFKSFPKIKPHISLDDFDDESQAIDARIPVWADFLKRRFPFINVIVSSEDYGAPLAKAMGAEHISFDAGRVKVPVAASSLRAEPFKYWDLMAESTKPFYVKKICFYGPESTGKSFLAEKLAKRYKTEVVPEVARELISNNDFSIDEILRIGNAQTQRVFDKVKTANKILFCDTDLITTQIYCRHYLHVVPPVLVDLERKVSYDRYFLFDTDVEWVADGMRDLGNRRQEMYHVFKSELDKREIEYDVVRGSYDEREKFVVDKIAAYFGVLPVT